MKKIALSALALTALAGVANAQSIEFRWVEIAGQNQVNIGATPSTTVTNGTDSRIYLRLDARVSGNGVNGLAGFGVDINTNDLKTRGTFFASGATGRNLAPANDTTDGTASPRPDQSNSQLGIYAPFRAAADAGLVNNDATGVANTFASSADFANPIARMLGLAPSTAAAGFFDAGDPDNGIPPGDFFGNSAVYGKDNFVPVLIFAYTVTDFTQRSITFSLSFPSLPGGFTNQSPVDFPNSIVELSLPSALPTYTLNVVPAPASAALLGLGGLVAARRRRA